jgi:gas vesicle protein
MFGKKFLIAAAAYIGGTIVATVFSSKKGEKVRADLEKAKEKGEGTKEILIANFIDTHKNFLEDLKSKVLTEENKEFVYKKIDEAKELVKEYKKEGEKMVDELKVK